MPDLLRRQRSERASLPRGQPPGAQLLCYTCIAANDTIHCAPHTPRAAAAHPCQKCGCSAAASNFRNCPKDNAPESSRSNREKMASSSSDVHSIPDFCNPAAISSFETSLLPAHQSTAQHSTAQHTHVFSSSTTRSIIGRPNQSGAGAFRYRNAPAFDLQCARKKTCILI